MQKQAGTFDSLILFTDVLASLVTPGFPSITLSHLVNVRSWGDSEFFRKYVCAVGEKTNSVSVNFQWYYGAAGILSLLRRTLRHLSTAAQYVGLLNKYQVAEFQLSSKQNND